MYRYDSALIARSPLVIRLLMTDSGEAAGTWRSRFRKKMAAAVAPKAGLVSILAAWRAWIEGSRQ